MCAIHRCVYTYTYTKTPNGVPKIIGSRLRKEEYSNGTSQEGLPQLLKLFDAIVVPIFCLVSCLSAPNREHERENWPCRWSPFHMSEPMKRYLYIDTILVTKYIVFLAF